MQNLWQELFNIRRKTNRCKYRNNSFPSAVSNDFDVAILISGDTDLVPAVEAIRNTFPNKQIGVVVPIGRRAKELIDVCDFHMKMKEKHLRTSQFPDTIVLDPQKNIVLQKPPTWI